MAKWHDYGMGMASIVLRWLAKMLPRHSVGMILVIEPTRDAPGIKLSGYHLGDPFQSLHIYEHDLLTPTYTVTFPADDDGTTRTLHFSGTLGFDQERVRKAVCEGEDVGAVDIRDYREEGYDEIE